jgi:hypothetical protein
MELAPRIRVGAATRGLGKVLLTSRQFVIKHRAMRWLADMFAVPLGIFCVLLSSAPSGRAQQLPPLSAALESKIDVWGEAAMRETNGASYEFFQNLLPPPRYVHADFRYYPIVLSAPDSRVKARLISDGSGLNLQGGSRSWIQWERR